MAKSIKLGADTYLDSSGVVVGQTPLNNYLDAGGITVTAGANATVLYNKSRYIDAKTAHIFCRVMVNSAINNDTLLSLPFRVISDGIVVPIFVSTDGEWDPSNTICYGFVGPLKIITSVSASSYPVYATVDVILHL